MLTLIQPTELTDRSTATKHDTTELQNAAIEWYERTGQAPRRREFDRDDRTPHSSAYTHQWDTFAQARDTILSTHDPAYDGITKRTATAIGETHNGTLTRYNTDDLRDWIVSWALEVGEPPQRNEFAHATPTPSPSTYERHFEGSFIEIRDRILLAWLDEESHREEFPWDTGMNNDAAHADD